MYGIKLADAVPTPQPAHTDRIVACHYYPGWQKDGYVAHKGFYDLENFPERTPIMGYYQESDSEATDWQIKWAVEHGINCFIYCWYRFKENVGKPVTREGIRLADAIHDGLFHAKLQDQIKFAIMWECDTAWGKVSDEHDLLENVLPYWIENYFSKNYLIVDNKPYVFVYAPEKLIEAFGSAQICAQMLAKANELAKKSGYDGIVFFADNNSMDAASQELLMQAGFACSFQYCWDIIIDRDPDRPDKEFVTVPDSVMEEYVKNDCNLREDYAVNTLLEMMQQRMKNYPNTSVITASSMRDSTPWFYLPRTLCPNGPMGPVAKYTLSPVKWRELLEGAKRIMDAYPENSLGRSMILLDNWNEYSEGHFIAPTLGAGFRYLQAVREVFTSRDNLPDYRTPELLGLGPYDEEWRKGSSSTQKASY